MPPSVAFVILLFVLLAWITLPLIPALMELMRPRDAAPLDAVGTDAGALTFFAESFTTRATHEGLLGTMIPKSLSDGTRVITHSSATPLPVQKQPFTDLVVIADTEPIPVGAAFTSECLARLTLRCEAEVTFRALLGQRDVLLGPSSIVQRWVHARGRLEVADNCHLWGRATAGRQITLGSNVRFERLESEVVRVSDIETPEIPDLPTGAYEHFVPMKASELGVAYWRIDSDITIPPGRLLIGSLISTGSVVVEDGARISGSLKAHGEIVVRTGAVISGSIAARNRITIERGARVSGPVISETAVILEAAMVGSTEKRTTVTAPIIRLSPGAAIYGAVMASSSGLTID